MQSAVWARGPLRQILAPLDGKPRLTALALKEPLHSKIIQRSVQVTGIYSNGLETGVLTDPACPQQTWVELDLRSTANKEILRSILDSKGRANVVFEGEFFGPDRPDPNLPEAIRKSYHPGWGHLGAFKTKLVVHVIRSVKAGK